MYSYFLCLCLLDRAVDSTHTLLVKCYPMDNKVFVSGLPYKVQNEELKAYFESAGTITDAVVIFDKMTRRSKGFGFVTFETEAQAQKSIEMFNETDFEGRIIRVSIARAREERPATAGGFRPRE